MTKVMSSKRAKGSMIGKQEYEEKESVTREVKRKVDELRGVNRNNCKVRNRKGKVEIMK
jgi:hypothetical protein